MRKLLAFVAIFCTMSVLSVNLSYADPDSTDVDTTNTTTTTVDTTAATTPTTDGATEVKESGFTQMVKQKFIEGNYQWMTPVLFFLILGLAIAIERIIYLNMAAVNTKKLLKKVEGALSAGGVDEAKKVCQNTSGPVAGIFLQGLEKAHEGVEMSEKALVAYGGVEVARMEKGLTWLNLCIALAPMLGFMGTVVGMIFAFDAIEAAGDISPNIVAGGMKVALLTTVAGLMVAVVLQIFYNYVVSRIEALTGQMEEASIDFIDLLERTGTAKKQG